MMWIILLKVLLAFAVCGVECYTTTVQTFESNGQYERGYITLKKYEGKRLNVTSFATFNVTTPLECAEECMMTKLDKCKGFNIGKTNESDVNSTEVVECNLLVIDRFRLQSQRFVNDSNYNYYEPATMCAAPNPCVNEMYDHPWCVAKSDIEPGCTCMPFKTGSYCELDDETAKHCNIDNSSDIRVHDENLPLTVIFWYTLSEPIKKGIILNVLIDEYEFTVEVGIVTWYFNSYKAIEFLLRKNNDLVEDNRLLYAEDVGWNLFTCSIKYKLNDSKIICYVNKKIYYESKDVFNKNHDGHVIARIGLGKIDTSKTSSTFTYKKALVLSKKIIIHEEVEDMHSQEWFPTSFPDPTNDISGNVCSDGPVKH